MNLHDLGFGDGVLDTTSKAQAIREKNRQIELHQYLKFLYIKGHYQESEKAMNRMREHICKPYI